MWCTPNRLRSAKNVNKCGQNVIGALSRGRIHNPKVGGSIPPPATNKINNLGGRHLAGLLSGIGKLGRGCVSQIVKP
jgi:hypothetical protein